MSRHIGTRWSMSCPGLRGFRECWRQAVGRVKEELKSMVTLITQNTALRTASVSDLSGVLVAIVDMHGLLIFHIQSTNVIADEVFIQVMLFQDHSDQSIQFCVISTSLS